MIREEGHYTIKRVDELPKKGNANWLYMLKEGTVDKLYRWPRHTGGYEEIGIGVSGAGDNIYNTNGILKGNRIVSLDGNNLNFQNANGEDMLYVNIEIDSEESGLLANNPTAGGNEANIKVTAQNDSGGVEIVTGYNAQAAISSLNLFSESGESSATLEADVIEINGSDVSLNINDVGGVQGSGNGKLQVIGNYGLEIRIGTSGSTIDANVGDVLTAIDGLNSVGWISPVVKEGYTESGTRAGGDLNVIVGDYDDSGHGRKITIDDYQVQIDADSDHYLLVSDQEVVLQSADARLQMNGGDIDMAPADNGRVFINTGGTNKSLNIITGTVPTTATDPGDSGDIMIDSDYIYRCVALNTWKRTPLSTW